MPRKTNRDAVETLFTANPSGGSGLPPLSYHRNYGPKLRMLRADQLSDSDTEFLLPGILIEDSNQVLVGSPGVGKSTLLATMAASISNPDLTLWIGKPKVKHGTVVIYSNEDAHGVLKERLKAANADLLNIRIISHATEEVGRKKEAFSLKRHGELLRKELASIPNVVAMFFDNISGLLDGFSSTNAGVREAFEYAKSIAPPKCAIVGLTHFRKDHDGKNYLGNMLGSGAIGQVARSVLAAQRVDGASAPDGSPLYALIRAKVSNGGVPGGGIYYSIEEVALSEGRKTTRIVWHDEFSSLDDESGEKGSRAQPRKKQLELAIEFLAEQLAVGPMHTTRLEGLARGRGISDRTFERAREALGVTSWKSKIDGKWWLASSSATREQVDQAAADAACNVGVGLSSGSTPA